MALERTFHQPAGVLSAKIVVLRIEIEGVTGKAHTELQLCFPQSGNVTRWRSKLRFRTGAGRLAQNFVEPVGHNAVRIDFDDLHDTGIYSCDNLYYLGQNRERLWADYLAALEAEGLSRDP